MANLSDLIHTAWHGGRLMAFSGVDGATDYYQGLTARSAFDAPGLEIKLPDECTIRFGIERPGDVLLASDFFYLRSGPEQVRGAFLDAYHLLIAGPCWIDLHQPQISVVQDRDRTLVGSSSHFNPHLIANDLDQAIARRQNWLQSISLPGSLPDSTRKTSTGAVSQVKGMVYAPEGVLRRRFTTPDRWPHRGMWLWDSAFHAIGIRHLDPVLAREILEAVLDGQRADGFVPIRTDPHPTPQVFTQPPVLALAACLVDETAPDLEWLRRIYPKLAAYVLWDLANRDSDGDGLVEWAIEEHANCRSGESGWDNSPRFDTANQLDAVDFNSFLALECEILTGFAGRLGLHEDAEGWQAHHQRLCSLIRELLWDEQAGFFVDYDVTRQAQSPIIAASGFLPLICRAATPTQVDQLAAHLQDTSMFATAFPVPTVAARDTAHYQKDMWRGPVWVNINWLIAYGFERNGRLDLARDIRARTRTEIEKFYARYATFFEFFDDRQEVDPPRLLRKGRLAPHQSPFHQVFFDYGWTATLYIDLVYSS